MIRHTDKDRKLDRVSCTCSHSTILYKALKERVSCTCHNLAITVCKGLERRRTC